MSNQNIKLENVFSEEIQIKEMNKDLEKNHELALMVSKVLQIDIIGKYNDEELQSVEDLSLYPETLLREILKGKGLKILDIEKIVALGQYLGRHLLSSLSDIAAKYSL